MISIFTPSHDPRFLASVYESIKDQPFDEWVILHNQGTQGWAFGDTRVKNFFDSSLPPHVGALKRRACELAKGDILVELDHDDLLAPGAIAAVRDAFDTTDAGFVYSNPMRVDAEWKPCERYAEGNGWQYREAEFMGHKVDEVVTFAPTPASVSRIWFAPDHLRAFRRDVYEAAGGYNPEMRVLDDQDLMARLYLQAPFHHIDKPLYVYRVHGQNAWIKHNAEIQQNVMRLYDQNIEGLALAWAGREGLRCLDLGGRFEQRPGYESVDLKDADVNANLDKRWPFEDSSVGVIRAFDVLEHLKSPLHAMKEAYRVLAPGGYMFCQVPSTDGRGAFQDPTHVSYWNENSFRYYSHVNWARFIDIPVRFQAPRLYTTPHDAIGVCWTVAHLVSMKDGYRPPGIVEI